MEAYWVTEAGTKPLPDDAVREMASRTDGVLWVQLNHTDEPAMALLTNLVPARSGDLNECDAGTPVPKLRVYADHYFSAMNGLARGTDGRLHFQPMKIFITPQVLFTTSPRPTSNCSPSKTAGATSSPASHCARPPPPRGSYSRARPTVLAGPAADPGDVARRLANVRPSGASAYPRRTRRVILPP
jgi:hypothetical protein